MTKKNLIEIIIVNIAANPHPEDIYFKLFETATGHKVTYSQNGDKLARFSKPRKIEEHPGFFSGHLLTWTGVSKDKHWIDLENEKDLDEVEKDEKLKEIDKLGKRYGLEAYKFYYIFDIKQHQLYIERKNNLQKTITPNQIKAILKKIMSIEIQGKDVPSVEITIIPDNQVVSTILNLPGLKKLEIGIVKPNPDETSDDVRAKVLKRLEEQKASKAIYTLFKGPKEINLTPDQETQDLAKVAAENGFVCGQGVDMDGHKNKLSTENKPKIIKLEDNPDETFIQKFFNKINLR